MTNARAALIAAVSLALLLTGAAALRDAALDKLPGRLASSIAACEGEDRGEKLACLDRLAERAVRAFAFPEIDRALAAAGIDCHDFMHFVAQKEYRETGNIGKLYGMCSFSCFGACYHGGIEGYAAEEEARGKPVDAIASALTRACPSGAIVYGQCVHGVGHALMLLTGNMAASLAFCDRFPANRQGTCYEGVFMENLPSSRLSPHPPIEFDPQNPLYPCSALAQKYQEVCYSFQAGRFIAESKGDMSVVERLCGEVPPPYRPHCFTRIGTSLPGGTFETARESCLKLAEREHRDMCLRGIADAFGDRFGGLPDKLLGVLDFCASVPEENKRGCFTRAGLVLRAFLSLDAARAECTKRVADPLFRESCALDGATKESGFSGEIN